MLELIETQPALKETRNLPSQEMLLIVLRAEDGEMLR